MSLSGRNGPPTRSFNTLTQPRHILGEEGDDSPVRNESCSLPDYEYYEQQEEIARQQNQFDNYVDAAFQNQNEEDMEHMQQPEDHLDENDVEHGYVDVEQDHDYREAVQQYDLEEAREGLAMSLAANDVLQERLEERETLAETLAAQLRERLDRHHADIETVREDRRVWDDAYNRLLAENGRLQTQIQDLETVLPGIEANLGERGVEEEELYETSVERPYQSGDDHVKVEERSSPGFQRPHQFQADRESELAVIELQSITWRLRLAEAEQKIQELQKRLQECEEHRNQQNTRVHNADGADQTSGLIQDLLTKITGLISALGASKARCENLEDQIVANQQQGSGEQGKGRKRQRVADDDYNEVEQDALSVAWERIDELGTQLAQCQRKLSDCEKHRNAAGGERAGAMSLSGTGAQDLLAELEQYKDAAYRNRDEANRWTDDVVFLKRENNKLKAEISDLTRQLKECQMHRKHADATDTLARPAGGFGRVERQQDDLERCRQHGQQFARNLQDEKQRRRALQAENETLKTASAKLQAALNACRQRGEEIDHVNQDLTERVHALVRQLGECRRHREALQSASATATVGNRPTAYVYIPQAEVAAARHALADDLRARRQGRTHGEVRRGRASRGQGGASPVKHAMTTRSRAKKG